MTQATAPQGLRATARIKSQFKRYKKIAWSVGFAAIWAYLFIFYMLVKSTAGCMSGMYVCRMDNAPFDLGPIVISWLVYLGMVIATIKLATKVDLVQSVLTDYEQEQLQLVAMQDAYMRSAEIAESRDNLHGTYHSKVYSAAVRDIENIINK